MEKRIALEKRGRPDNLVCTAFFLINLIAYQSDKSISNVCYAMHIFLHYSITLFVRGSMPINGESHTGNRNFRHFSTALVKPLGPKLDRFGIIIFKKIDSIWPEKSVRNAINSKVVGFNKNGQLLIKYWCNFEKCSKNSMKNVLKWSRNR